MILVLLGTQIKPFVRILEYLEKSNIQDEIIVQAGNTKFVSNKMQINSFFTKEKLDELINQADVVICHGGVGVILDCLKKEKKVIAIARLSKFGEHVNDHQKEVIEAFVANNYIFEYREDIENQISQIKNHQFDKYQFGNQKMITNLKNFIDNN